VTTTCGHAPDAAQLSHRTTVAPYVGVCVRVTGRFRFRDYEGRRIDLDDLEALTP
jgi:hypothetical protein